MGRCAAGYDFPQKDESSDFRGFLLEADDGARTRDPWLGKPMLYQLSYVRGKPLHHTIAPVFQWLIGGMSERLLSDDD